MTTNQAIAKYGKQTCIDAYELHKQGNGASTIGFYLNLTTRQADCAIDAGRALEYRDEDLEIEQANLLNELEYNK